MYVDWVEKWLSFTKEGQTVNLHGIGSEECTHTCVSLSAIQVDEQAPVPPEMLVILDELVDVFAIPKELPPRRNCDHKIPLIPGARLVAMRPYKIVPHLKDELENRLRNYCSHV